MARKSFIRMFKDPVTRPRAIVWMGVGVLGLALVAIVGIVGTSTIGFCGNFVCHKVQGDTMDAYAASPHANISCMACHEPVGANPVRLVMAKVKSMGEIPPTLGNTYELPINKGSALALNEEEMTSGHCTQCHSGNRRITPTHGIIINHKAHAEEDITCTTCHNRVAHADGVAGVKLPDNVLHEDFTEMDACFRCHDLESKRRAAGTCSLCHPKDFTLVPETHDASGWLPRGHAEAARESLVEYGMAKAEAEELVKEGIAEDVAVAVEHCSTCHRASFCTGCHNKLAAGLKLSKK